MIKICFLLGGFQGNGGIGRVTSILANELNTHSDYEVCTISYCQTDQPLLYKISDEIQQFHLYDGSISMTKALLFNGAVRKVKQILKQNHVDIVVACGALYYPLAIMACHGNNIKCICWEHTNPATNNDYKFQNYCRKYALKRCDKMVVLTRAAEKYYLNELKIKRRKLVQIYNPVGKEVSKTQQYDMNATKIISVGRLSYQKNIERLIDIAYEVLPFHQEWIWDIYGDGDLRETLQTKIDKLGLGEKVILKGQVNDIYERYKDYSFLVMTSRYEGFPMSLIEAASNRLPLVSFDIPTGPNEIIVDGENGFLVDHAETQIMVDKINKLIRDPELREKMSSNAYTSVKQFNLQEVVGKWNSICQEVMRD